MEQVKTTEKNEIHQDTTGATPNQLYARYKAWFEGHYGKEKQPLSFKEWLKWAQSKNIFAQDLDKQKQEAIQKNAELNEAIGNVKNTRKNLAIALVVIVGIFIAIGLTRKTQAE
mgnify:CR=1 FL=1